MKLPLLLLLVVFITSGSIPFKTEAQSSHLIFKGVRIPQNKFVKGRVLIRPTRALAERLTAGATVWLNASRAFDSKWASMLYSHPKVAKAITILKKKMGLEDISAIDDDGLPKVFFAGFRLFRQRQSTPGRLTRLLNFLEKEGFDAEPDYVADLFTVPNDMYYKDQSANMNLINAPLAWSSQTGSGNVNVCIIDSGMLCSSNCNGSQNPDIKCLPNDLTPNCRIINKGLLGTGSVAVMDATYNYKMSQSHSIYYPYDYSHGTMVASVLAASGNNGVGTAGVAWKASVFACAPFSDLMAYAGISASLIAACANFCNAYGAHIVQISMGIQNQLLSSVMAESFVNLEANNILVIAAAGNDGKEYVRSGPKFQDVVPWQPQFYNGWMDNIIVVGSVNANGTLANYSNYGSMVDILAPGNQLGLTDTNNQYKNLTGTSFAAPVVAGAAALLLSSYQQKNPTPECVKTILMLSARRNLAVQGYSSSGILDMGAMLSPPPLVNLPAIQASCGTSFFSSASSPPPPR